MSLLEIKDLSVCYQQSGEVVHKICIKVPEKQIVCLLGANGAGKTTVLRAISRMLFAFGGKVSSGCIVYDGKTVNKWETHQMVHCGLVMVPEERNIFKQLTVLENLKASASLRNISNSELNLEIETIFDYFPKLKKFRSIQAGYCSGGEQQMLAIGRALMTKPKALLLDEPSMGLAPMIVQEIFEILKKMNDKTSILLVEQNANLALEYADYGYVLETGKIVLEGAAQNLRHNPEVREYYMGIKEENRKSYKDVKGYRLQKRWS